MEKEVIRISVRNLVEFILRSGRSGYAKRSFRRSGGYGKGEQDS